MTCADYDDCICADWDRGHAGACHVPNDPACECLTCEPAPACMYCATGPAVVAGLCRDCVVSHALGACESRPGACDACARLASL